LGVALKWQSRSDGFVTSIAMGAPCIEGCPKVGQDLSIGSTSENLVMGRL